MKNFEINLSNDHKLIVKYNKEKDFYKIVEINGDIEIYHSSIYRTKELLNKHFKEKYGFSLTKLKEK